MSVQFEEFRKHIFIHEKPFLSAAADRRKNTYDVTVSKRVVRSGVTTVYKDYYRFIRENRKHIKHLLNRNSRFSMQNILLKSSGAKRGE